MPNPVTALELQGNDNYSIYMRYGGDQLVCRIEAPKGAPDNSAKFMQELNSLGITTRKDNAARRACTSTTKLCDHSSCFGMAVTPLKKTLTVVWEAANTLYGSPRVMRILTAGPERPVFEWTPGRLSHYCVHRNTAQYEHALGQLQVFSSIKVQAGSSRIDMMLAPGVTLDSALQEAHRVLAAH